MTQILLPGGGVIELPETVLDIEDGAITIHEHKALAHRVERWHKAAFTAYQRSWGPEFQQLEAALWDIYASRFLDYATGAQLDILGRIVGEGRNGKADPSFRVRLRARIAINSSKGTAPDILNVLLLIEPGIVPTIEDTPPAAFRVTYGVPLSGYATHSELAQIVKEARAAGVGANVSMPTETADLAPWRFNAAGQAWGDLVSGDYGGVLGDGRFV